MIATKFQTETLATNVFVQNSLISQTTNRSSEAAVTGDVVCSDVSCGEVVGKGTAATSGFSAGLDTDSFVINRMDIVNRTVKESMNSAVAEVDASLASASPSQTIHSYRMRCECLEERTLMDLVDHVLSLRYELRDENPGPMLIHVADYQEAMDIDRRLSALKLRTHLASPFSNWTNVFGKLGTGQIDVIITTTVEIPHVEQIQWQAIYLPSALHLAMLTTPSMDWLGNFWFANNLDEQPPRLIVRRGR